MHVRPTPATLLLACAAATAFAAQARAEPADALKPMAFLAGHCWKGTFPDGKQTDEHCFTWLYGGKALRDTHTVRTPGRADYVGETTYYVDQAARRVDFLYIENLGGVSRGTMESTPDALVFPNAQYVDADGAMTYRARWTPKGADAYEAWSEAQGKDGWKTMFRMLMQRQP
jgi:hypothetical protein